MKSRKRPAKKPIEEEEEEEEKELVVNDARKTKSFEKIKKEDFELMLIVDSGERGGKGRTEKGFGERINRRFLRQQLFL